MGKSIKYIISENRLVQFAEYYLNNFILNKNFFHTDNYIVISNPYQYGEDSWIDYIEYDYSDGRLWINKSLFSDLRDLFLMEDVQLQKFLIRWFENRFNVQVKFIQI